MVDMPLPSAADIAAMERAHQRLQAADLELEAWKVAQLAATLVAGNATPSDDQPGGHWPVRVARALLAESRRQVAAERGSA